MSITSYFSFKRPDHSGKTTVNTFSLLGPTEDSFQGHMFLYIIFFYVFYWDQILLYLF